jgi:hypothetical protein
LHGVPHTGANVGERVDGDQGRVDGVPWCGVVFHHLDTKQVFAHFLVVVREEFITMKTLSILAALDHLGGSQPPH